MQDAGPNPALRFLWEQLHFFVTPKPFLLSLIYFLHLLRMGLCSLGLPAEMCVFHAAPPPSLFASTRWTTQMLRIMWKNFFTGCIFFVFSLACRDCNEFHKNRMYKLMYKLMTSMAMENHRKMNYDSKYVNLYTIIFTFHALFMDYTGGTLLMCFSILTDVDNSKLMMMYDNNILTSVH